MKTRITIVLIFALGVVVGAFAGSDLATMAVPTEYKGVTFTSLGSVSEESLEKQIGLQGYELHLNELIIAPGGTLAKHSHANQPGMVQTTSGAWVEGRTGADGAIGLTEYSSGNMQVLAETWDTEHWGRNTGDEDAKLIVCNIVPVPASP